MEKIDGFTILSGVLIVLTVAFLTAGLVYLSVNIVAHAIISQRKAKRHPMGYYTGTTRRNTERTDMGFSGFELQDKIPASRK